MNLEKPMRIIFMGTPEFAVASLDALLVEGLNVVAVVTAPDKPAGRGMQVQQSAVKQYALAHAIPVLQPVKLKDPGFLEQLRALKPDIQVVVAFRMLPEAVWSLPPLGSLNLHASLLPQYRGAAPINWAIINGEQETGLTTFRLRHEIDTGDMLLQARLPIGENERAGELHDRMKVIGAGLLVQTLKKLARNELTPIPQQDTVTAALRHAPKIFSDTCRIDFSQTAAGVHNLIRGLSPFPGAFTELNGKMLKIYDSRKEETSTINLPPPGTLVTDGKKIIRFACSDGYIRVNELQAAGKKRMSAEEFLRGYRGPVAGLNEERT
jgi:methionyl-tRNA formyltransferase